MNKENLKDISFVFSDGPGTTAFLAWLRGWYGSTSLRNQKQTFSLYSRIFTVALRYFLIQSCNIKAATRVPKLHLALNGITFFRIKRKIVSEYFQKDQTKHIIIIGKRNTCCTHSWKCTALWCWMLDDGWKDEELTRWYVHKNAQSSPRSFLEGA